MEHLEVKPGGPSPKTDRPAVRWLVDGMNLIGSRPDRWWNDPDRAVRRLIEELDRYATAADEDLTVVFDRQPPDAAPGAHGAIRWRSPRRTGGMRLMMRSSACWPRTRLRAPSGWSPRTGGWGSGSASWAPA